MAYSDLTPAEKAIVESFDRDYRALMRTLHSIILTMDQMWTAWNTNVSPILVANTVGDSEEIPKTDGLTGSGIQTKAELTTVVAYSDPLTGLRGTGSDWDETGKINNYVRAGGIIIGS